MSLLDADFASAQSMPAEGRPASPAELRELRDQLHSIQQESSKNARENLQFLNEVGSRLGIQSDNPTARDLINAIDNRTRLIESSSDTIGRLMVQAASPHPDNLLSASESELREIQLLIDSGEYHRARSVINASVYLSPNRNRNLSALWLERTTLLVNMSILSGNLDAGIAELDNAIGQAMRDFQQAERVLFELKVKKLGTLVLRARRSEAKADFEEALAYVQDEIFPIPEGLSTTSLALDAISLRGGIRLNLVSEEAPEKALLQAAAQDLISATTLAQALGDQQRVKDNAFAAAIVLLGLQGFGVVQSVERDRVTYAGIFVSAEDLNNFQCLRQTGSTRESDTYIALARQALLFVTDASQDDGLIAGAAFMSSSSFRLRKLNAAIDLEAALSEQSLRAQLVALSQFEDLIEELRSHGELSYLPSASELETERRDFRAGQDNRDRWKALYANELEIVARLAATAARSRHAQASLKALGIIQDGLRQANLYANSDNLLYSIAGSLSYAVPSGDDQAERLEWAANNIAGYVRLLGEPGSDTDHSMQGLALTTAAHLMGVASAMNDDDAYLRRMSDQLQREALQVLLHSGFELSDWSSVSLLAYSHRFFQEFEPACDFRLTARNREIAAAALEEFSAMNSGKWRPQNAFHAYPAIPARQMPITHHAQLLEAVLSDDAISFLTKAATPVTSTVGGRVERVTEVSYAHDPGVRIELRGDDGLSYVFSGLASAEFAPGDTVRPGEVIGLTGKYIDNKRSWQGARFVDELAEQLNEENLNVFRLRVHFNYAGLHALSFVPEGLEYVDATGDALGRELDRFRELDSHYLIQEIRRKRAAGEDPPSL